MRIQKAISQSGLTSRREAEAMIIAGRVSVNNELIYHPGFEVDLKKDEILVDGKPLPSKEQHVYYALHKPKGYICSRKDEQARPSVYDFFSLIPYRIEAVGRLDFNTSGILLLTNDGVLAHNLTQPKVKIPRRYKVKVWKRPAERQMNRLLNGINLEEGRVLFEKVKVIESTETNNTWLEVTSHEGKSRIIRRMFDAVGHPVSKLQRISFATVNLGKLEPKRYRVLRGEEVERLKAIGDGTPLNKIKRQKKYKKGYALPKIKKSPLRKKKRK